MNDWIDQTAEFVRKRLEGAESGHDWHHTRRVWRMARDLAEREGADALTVELAALLHDVADHKFHGGDEEIGPRIAAEWLTGLGVDAATVAHVTQIVRHISFKGGVASPFRSLEFDVTQDADRLDALGAIGIARTFNYGGFRNRAMYDPAIPPTTHADKESYKNSAAPTINHFYEKLLLLKDRMNTASGRAEAERRHAFMETFLEEFYREWGD
ncbi:MAG: HD domain-containing protein [Saprospiraceae bacterium]